MKLAIVFGLAVGLLGLTMGVRAADVSVGPLERLEPGTEEGLKETIRQGLARGENVIPSVRILRCEDGPRRAVHTDGSIQYWPVVTKTSCDGLPCSEGKCTPTAISRPIVTRRLAYRIITAPKPDIVILGWRSVRIHNHIGPCTCPSCARFTTFEQCQCEDDCPGFKPDRVYQNSFCFWNETTTATSTRPLQYVNGECECCKVPRTCPLNHAFSRSDCECKCIRQVCPKPKYWNEGNCRCECPKIKCPPPKYYLNPVTCRCECPKIICRPPKYLNRENCRCECPKITCPPHHVVDSVSCRCVCKRRCPPGTELDTRTCTCIGVCEHFNGNDLCETVNCSPTRSCKLDRKGNCNCTRISDCADITDRKQCVNTRCPNQPEFTCQYDIKNRCHCPCCYPRTDPPAYNCASISHLGPARCKAVAGGACNWLCPLP